MAYPGEDVSLADFLKSRVTRWLNPKGPFFVYQVLGLGGLALLVVAKLWFLPAFASGAVEVVAEGYGMDLVVEDWDASLHDLTVRAENVTFLARGAYAQEELLVAETMELDLSLWGGVFGDGWLREMRIEEPTLYLERLASGRWNWEDAGRFRLDPNRLEGISERGLRTAGLSVDDDSVADFVLPKVVIDRMKLQWVENLPAQSGGGLIQDLRASLFVDDISLQATDLRGLVDLRPQPSELSLEARTGDGKISFDGDLNMFFWSAGSAEVSRGGMVEALEARTGPDTQVAAVPRGPRWSPTLQATLYLENVGAGAFARLTPDAAIVTERGTMTGTIELAMENHQVACVANVNLLDVTFKVNDRSPFLQGRRTRGVSAELANYRANGQYQFPCGGFLDDGDEEFRPFQAFQTAVVRQGLSNASRSTRAVAELEHARYSQEALDPAVESEALLIARGVSSEVIGWLNLAHEIDRAIPGGLRPPPGAPAPGGVRRFLDRFRR